ncbi:MAG: hypothetical protein AAF404_04710 [Pseudomonadota bacterium]
MTTDLTMLLEHCANSYRLGREAEAATMLQQVVNRFGSIIEQNPALLTPSVEASVAASLNYQQGSDWIALADELQYVLKPQIERMYQ